MRSDSLAPKPAPEWLGLGQAARFLGVHPITLRRWADQGDIPVMLTPGGHRRFALSDLRHFGEAHRQLRPAAANVLEQNWADQALQRTRQEIIGRHDQPWLAAFGETGRRQQRELGQRLMGVMLQFVSLNEGGDDLLAEAQTIGRAYGESALALGLSLVEALQAMLFFRDTLVEAAVLLPESTRVRPEANARLVRRISQLLNAVQLSIAGIYEKQKR
jgi:excisionase family DNA binding protein